MAERIIGKQPDQIGGAYATTALPHDHLGSVTLLSGWDVPTVEATFPSLAQAHLAACYAVTPDGGYSNVSLIDGQELSITHTHWYDWALG